jgi:hypothetical protein
MCNSSAAGEKEDATYMARKMSMKPAPQHAATGTEPRADNARPVAGEGKDNDMLSAIEELRRSAEMTLKALHLSLELVGDLIDRKPGRQAPMYRPTARRATKTRQFRRHIPQWRVYI